VRGGIRVAGPGTAPLFVWLAAAAAQAQPVALVHGGARPVFRFTSFAPSTVHLVRRFDEADAADAEEAVAAAAPPPPGAPSWLAVDGAADGGGVEVHGAGSFALFDRAAVVPDRIGAARLEVGLLFGDGAAGKVMLSTLRGARRCNLAVVGGWTAGSEAVEVERTAIADGEQVGLLVERGGRLALRDSRLAGNEWSGMEVRDAGSNPMVVRTDFVDGASSGLFAHDGGSGRFSYCHFSRNQLPAVEVALGAEPVLTHCYIEGGPETRAVLATEFGGGRFVDCDVSSAGLQPVFIDQGADPSERDATLAQKLGQLQPFLAVFPQECMGQLAYFGPTLTPFIAPVFEDCRIHGPGLPGAVKRP
jgi:hypothetical protein